MDGDDNMTDDFFSMEFGSIGELIKRLDMFDEKQNTAVVNARYVRRKAEYRSRKRDA